MIDKTTRVLRRLKQKKIKMGNNFILPNTSGDHQRGIKRNDPSNNYDLVNKSYVDSQDSPANTHITSDGSDHSFIDQDVTITGTPTHASLTLTNQFVLKDNVEIRLGTGTDATLDWSTNQANNSLVMGVGNTSSTLILTKVQNRNKDHDHGNQVHPTLFVHSEKDPDTANNEWISIGHDGTQGVINTGKNWIKTNNGLKLGSWMYITQNNVLYMGTTGANDTILRASSSKNQFEMCVGSNQSRVFAIMDRTNSNITQGFGVQTNPSLAVCSSTNPNTATDEYILLTHDKTNGVIKVGSGNLELNAVNQVKLISGTNIQCTGKLFMNDGTNLANNKILEIGSNADSSIFWDTGQTNNSLLLEISGAKHLILADQDNNGDNYAHANSTNPTLIIHSATSAGIATDEWISFTHDQTDGVIDVGSGTLKLASSGMWTANGTNTVTISNVAPASVSIATISKWLTLVDNNGVTYFIPAWT